MLSAILGLVMVACIIYLVLPRSLKLIHTLDLVHQATIHPEGTFTSMANPYDGSILTRIVIIQEEGGADVPWRAAYICEKEDIFWIIDSRGGFNKILWYGSFDASWDKTNVLATIGAVISCIATMIVIVTRHTLKKLVRASKLHDQKS